MDGAGTCRSAQGPPHPYRKRESKVKSVSVCFRYSQHTHTHTATTFTFIEVEGNIGEESPLLIQTSPSSNLCVLVPAVESSRRMCAITFTSLSLSLSSRLLLSVSRSVRRFFFLCAQSPYYPIRLRGLGRKGGRKGSELYLRSSIFLKEINT